MYFQHPTLHHETLFFVQGESLWRASIQGGQPQRLTAPFTGLAYPRLSPTGQQIAFLGNQELYIISSWGGVPKKVGLPWEQFKILRWLDEEHLLVIAFKGEPFREGEAWVIHIPSKQKYFWDWGPCEDIAMSGPWHKETLPRVSSSFLKTTSSYSGALEQKESVDLFPGAKVIQRGGYGYASWQRYQGGCAGELWVDALGTGKFQQILKSVHYNLVYPLWVGSRIFFLCDQDGLGNLYSCLPDGTDMKQHTHHQDFYVRQPFFDGENRIVYTCAGKLWVYSADTDQTEMIPVVMDQEALEEVQVSWDPEKFLHDFQPSGDGKQLALTTRGQLFRLTPHRGPVHHLGDQEGVRYRNVTYLNDKSLLALCDRKDKHFLEVYPAQGSDQKQNHEVPYDCGRVSHLWANPQYPLVALSNHRHELWVLDLETNQAYHVDTSSRGALTGVSWSPCGFWLAYGKMSTLETSSLHLYHKDEKTIQEIQGDEFFNSHPIFDPDGKQIFFLSRRHFDGHWDDCHLSIPCVESLKPYALVLQKDVLSPFMQPFSPGPSDQEGEKKNEEGDTESENSKKTEDHEEKEGSCEEKISASSGKKEAEKKQTAIDFEGLKDRLVEFPVPPRSYVDILALKGQVIYAAHDAEGGCEIFSYDLSQLKEESLMSQVHEYAFSLNGEWMLVKMNRRLRLVQSGRKPDDGDTSFHQGGWIQWSRIDLRTKSRSEWRLMLYEAWRLQRDHFWTPAMGEVDWEGVLEKYMPLVQTLSNEDELMMLIMEMHGELGTSHAYVMPGPGERENKRARDGFLGAEWQWDEEKGGYKITQIYEGDAWKGSPLKSAGVNLRVGDWLMRIGGEPLSLKCTPDDLLRGKSDQVVEIEVLLDGGAHRQRVTESERQGEPVPEEEEGVKKSLLITPFSRQKEREVFYRHWVKSRREWVHQKTNGQVGYLHVPDMGPWGWKEFLRAYLAEYDRLGLIIDVRYNGGGNISPALLNLLTRKRLGYDQTRHQGLIPYPSLAPRGVMVALANERAGSDGDVFVHSFKTLKLGPVVGKRTWGGVVGIWPRNTLLNGSLTSQPEFAFFFEGVGWSIENFGVQPDQEVDNRPEDCARGRDAQLETAVSLALNLVEENRERFTQSATPPKEPVRARPVKK